MPAPEIEIKTFFTALASPTRLAMLWLLSERPHTRTELMAMLAITRANAHNELTVLRRAGLIVQRPHSRDTISCLSATVSASGGWMSFTVAGTIVKIEVPHE